MQLVQAFDKICDFDDGQADHPETPADGNRWTMANVERSMGKAPSRQKGASKL